MMAKRSIYTISPHVIFDASIKEPRFAVTVNQFSISDLFYSECGKFTVDPYATYGYTKAEALQLRDLNERLGQNLKTALSAAISSYRYAFDIADNISSELIVLNNDSIRQLQDFVINLICQEFGFGEKEDKVTMLLEF